MQELSGAAAIIEQDTFRSFETYIIVTVIYLVLALSLKLLPALARRSALPAGLRSRPRLTEAHGEAA